MYPHICILPIPIHVSVSVLHSLQRPLPSDPGHHRHGALRHRPVCASPGRLRTGARLPVAQDSRAHPVGLRPPFHGVLEGRSPGPLGWRGGHLVAPAPRATAPGPASLAARGVRGHLRRADESASSTLLRPPHSPAPQHGAHCGTTLSLPAAAQRRN